MTSHADPLDAEDVSRTDASYYPSRRNRKNRLVVVQTCCCGCTLGQGTVGAGLWATIESILVVIGGAYVLQLGKEAEIYRNVTDQHGNITYVYSREELNKLQITGVIYIAQGTSLLLASIILLLGVKTKRRTHLIPWLLVRGIQIALNIVCITLLFIRGQKLSALVISIVWTVVMIYLYVVVFSYYQSDMNRIWSHEDILDSMPPRGSIPPELYYNTPYNVNVPLPTCPPLGPPGYPYPQPVVPFYPEQPGVHVNRISHFPPQTNPYFQPQNQYNACDQPPPYSAISENQRRRESSPKRY